MTKAREIAELGQKLTVDGSGNLDIAGTVEANSIQVEGNTGSLINVYRASANANFDAITFKDTTNTNINGKIGWNANELRLEGTNTIRLLSGGNASAIFGSNGDTTLYRDDGSTIHTIFDASNGFTDHRGTLKISSNQNDPNDSTGAYFTNKSGWGPTVHGYRFRVNAGGSGTHTNVFAVGTNMGAVFNEDGVDHDFRIESDTNTHNLFLDAGTGRIGIRTASPAYTLDVVGDVALSAATSLVGKGGVGGDTQLLYWQGTTAFYGRNSLGGSVTNHEFRSGGTTRLSVNSGEVVVNDTSGDYDFRVESDTYSNAIFVNAGTGEVNFDGARTNFGGINVETADGEINAGLIKLRNSNTTSGQFLSIDAEGTSAGQSMIHYWYDGAYRNRFQVAGNTGATVVNESGLDVDFRVESDTNSNALFVDAGTSRVGINTTSAPTGDLQVVSELVVGSATTGVVGSFNLYENGNNYFQMKGSTGLANTVDTQWVGTSSIGNLNINETNVTINDKGENADFRVESDTYSHALFVDANVDGVGVKGSASQYVGLRVNDNMQVGRDDSHNAGLTFQKAFSYDNAGGTAPTSGHKIKLTFSPVADFFMRVTIYGLNPYSAVHPFTQSYEFVGYAGGSGALVVARNDKSGSSSISFGTPTFSPSSSGNNIIAIPVTSTTTSYRFHVMVEMMTYNEPGTFSISYAA